MKRCICFIIILLMLLSAGCSSKEPEQTPAVTQQAVADSTPQFVFSKDNFPVIDGSTSAKPMAAAVTSVLLGISKAEAEQTLEFHRTTQSFRNLMNGDCEVILAGQPSETVFNEMDSSGFKYELEEIATDALVFVVNSNNPVDSLTTEQIRKIYTGEITNWSELGGNDEAIVPFQRNEGAGSQALMLKLVMGDVPMMEPPTGFVATEMGELMSAVRSYDNSSAAIGYSVYYYANDMKMADGLKIISVDGVPPCEETIRSGQYPHLNAYYCVIAASAEQGSPERMLFNWVMSGEGQRLLEDEGYVAVAPESTELVNVKTDYSAYSQDKIGNVYTRLSDKPVTDLRPREDYGMLYPYSGSPMITSYESGIHISGYKYGLFDKNGRLVTDPVYSSIEPLSWYDYSSGQTKKVKFWKLQKAYGEIQHDPDYNYNWVNDQSLYAYCSVDGRIVSDCIYKNVLCNALGIVAAEQDGGFTIFDFSGNVITTDDSLGIRDLLDESSVYTIRDYKGDFYIQLSDGRFLRFNTAGEIVGSPVESDAFYELFEDFFVTEKVDSRYSDWIVCGKDGHYSKQEKNGIIIADSKTGKEMFFEGMDIAHPFYTMAGEADLPYIQVSHYDSVTGRYETILLSKGLEIVDRFTGGGVSCIQDEINESWYIVRYDENEKQLLDDDLQEICSFSSTVRVCDSVVVEQNETYCQAVSSGNVLFRYIYPAAAVE